MATNQFGQYVPDEQIQNQLGHANRLRSTPIVPHWTGVLAQALAHGGAGFLTGDANQAMDSNKTTMSNVLRAAGQAPDNTAASRIMMDSGIPGMGEKGLGFLMDSRAKAADREAQARMQRENFEFQKRLAMDLENQKRQQQMEMIQSVFAPQGAQEAAQPGSVPEPSMAAPGTEGAPTAAPAPAMSAPAAQPISPRQAARLIMAGVPKPAVEMLMQRGGVSKDVADMEQSLRKEYATLAKPYFDVRDAFSRVEQAASQPSAAGDLALIFNYMKMLDPGSVVREGEFATAQNAAGIDDRIKNIYNRLVSGERLNDNMRDDFVGQARGLFQRQERQYQAIQNQYRQIAGRLGLDTRNTFLDFTRPADPSEDDQPDVQAADQAAPQSKIPAEAIQYLRGNPRIDIIRQFEEKYGPGSAAQYLRAQ